MILDPRWIVPDWPAPRRVRAFVTTRAGGVSEGDYASLNLGRNSGDDPSAVASNRAIVRAYLPAEPTWLAQVHGTDVARAADFRIQADRTGEYRMPEPPRADACVADAPGQVCVVLTADCMPVFFCDHAGTRVAVAHAGWRGLAAGVLESTVAAMKVAPAHLIAWMGPAIGPDAFEVGFEVREAFLARDAGAADAFRDGKPGKYMADLYALARRRLASAGVAHVHGGGFDTYGDTARFFSYRRVAQSGRMGAFIWMD
jgi:YfiH family protein